ncbi:MAG TPA: hypothetical protein VFQ72_02030 [Candidatus Paceibacterota bacterium]|nr:hypothetical protein [Candidatus Paceibacterota bacterium]
MSKKLFFFIILAVIAVLGVAGWWFLRLQVAAPAVQQPDQTGEDLFPFGSGAVKPSEAKPATTTQPVSNVTAPTSPAAQPRLRKLSSEPAVSAAFVYSATSTRAVRFVDRATGHILEAAVDSALQSTPSNVTIPQVREALWGDKASSLVYRYLKGSTVQSFYAALKSGTATSSQPIEGIFLPSDIRSMAVTGGKILYFDPSVESGRLIMANMDGSKKATVWTSDFGEWAISSVNPAKAFIYTKPSASANGVGYIVDTTKGTATKVVGDAAGLEGSIGPSGDYVFLSAASGSGIASASYSAAKKTVSQLSLSTLASKCAWSGASKKTVYCGIPANLESAAYPDDWYKGSVSFSDRLWKIDMETGETEVVLDPFLDSLNEFDMTNLTVDPTDTYLAFVNKKDLSLWLYKIK